MEEIKNIGLRFKAIRKGLKLSQKEMSLKIKTDQPKISHLEKGDGSSLLFKSLSSLVQELGVNLNWLISNEGNPLMGDREFLNDAILLINNQLQKKKDEKSSSTVNPIQPTIFSMQERQAS